MIIHIQEKNSSQITEIVAPTLEAALMAYVRNAAYAWDEFDGRPCYSYPRRTAQGRDIIEAAYFFRSEHCVLYKVAECRFYAEWGWDNRHT